MYSKIRIIISSSFFGAGLRKKENKKKYCFWEKNLYLSKHDNESKVQYVWFQNCSPISIIKWIGFSSYRSLMDWIFIVLINDFKWYPDILVLWMTTGVNNPVHVQVEVIKLIVIRIRLACVYRDLYTIDFSGLKEYQEFNFDSTNSGIS